MGKTRLGLAAFRVFIPLQYVLVFKPVAGGQCLPHRRRLRLPCPPSNFHSGTGSWFNLETTREGGFFPRVLHGANTSSQGSKAKDEFEEGSALPKPVWGPQRTPLVRTTPQSRKFRQQRTKRKSCFLNPDLGRLREMNSRWALIFRGGGRGKKDRLKLAGGGTSPQFF